SWKCPPLWADDWPRGVQTEMNDVRCGARSRCLDPRAFYSRDRSRRRRAAAPSMQGGLSARAVGGRSGRSTGGDTEDARRYGRAARRTARCSSTPRTGVSAGSGLACRAVVTLHDARDLAVDLVDRRLRARDQALALLPDLLVRIALAGVERAQIGDQTLGGLDLVREVAR